MRSRHLAALMLLTLPLAACSIPSITIGGDQTPTPASTVTVTATPTPTPSAAAPTAAPATGAKNYSWVPDVRAKATIFANQSDDQMYLAGQFFCATIESAQIIYPADKKAAYSWAFNTMGESYNNEYGSQGAADLGYLGSQAVPFICPEQYDGLRTFLLDSTNGFTG